MRKRNAHMTVVFAVVVLCLWLSLVPRVWSAEYPMTTAIGVSASSGQVACGGGSAVLLKAATTTGRKSITFQNHSAVAVYIAPRSDITAANAGILLGNQYTSVTLDRSSGDVVWYCITGGGAATVGWVEEK